MSNAFTAAAAQQRHAAEVAGVRPGVKRTVTEASAEESAKLARDSIARTAHAEAMEAHYARGDADRITSLKARLATVKGAHATAEGVRADRLDALAFLIGNMLSRLTGGVRPVLASEVGANGLFVRYVRANYRHVSRTPDHRDHVKLDGVAVAYRAPGMRSDLGLLAYGPDDIVQDALALALQWAEEDRAAYEQGTADDRQVHAVEALLRLPATVGDAVALPVTKSTLFLAIRVAYKRGMGAAGAILRGKTVEWIDGVPTGVESDSVKWAREASQARMSRIVSTVAGGEPDDEATPEEVAAADAYAAKLATLKSSWPISHDSALPTVAALLLEGYTVDQIADEYRTATGRDLTPATLTRWARQMGSFIRSAA